MYRRILVFVGLVVILLALAGSAAANSPWVPIWSGPCSGLWGDSEGNPLYIPGEGEVTYLPEKDIYKGVCNYFVDFDDPGLASLELACELLPQYCSGGMFVNPEFEGCYWNGQQGYEGKAIVKSNGYAHIRCLFNAPAE